MKTIINTLIILYVGINFTFCQSSSIEKNIINPILIDKSSLSGVGLQKITLKDTPERDFYQKNLYRGKDFSVYIVSSESWIVPFEKFWFDEFIYILNGKSKVHTEDKVYEFKSGEYFYAPKGFKGEWEVIAGQHPHCELSIISNQRSDSAAINNYTEPALFDKNLLSGTHFSFNESGIHKDIIMEGSELSMYLFAEELSERNINKNEKEKLIHILSGQLTLRTLDGFETTFFTGDYFILPEGYQGKWICQGHGYVKYITIEKS